jgi:hypothetical protein
MNKIVRSVSLLKLAFAASCAFASGTTTKANEDPPVPASEVITSITLQELEPGICDPVMFEARGTGFTGAGYINSPNDKAARITWSVKSPAGGPHTLESASPTAANKPARA